MMRVKRNEDVSLADYLAFFSHFFTDIYTIDVCKILFIGKLDAIYFQIRFLLRNITLKKYIYIYSNRHYPQIGKYTDIDIGSWFVVTYNEIALLSCSS